MTFPEAQQLVLQKINDPAQYPEAAQNPLAILKTTQKPNGWVFYYDSAKAIETGDRKQYSVLGNTPVFVGIDGTFTYLELNDPLLQ